MSQRQPSEEELRAALEAELKRLRVGDVLLQTVVTLINVGARRAGLAPGAEAERDLGQVRQAVEAVRALLPVLESGEGEEAVRPEDLAPIRDALAQLQMAFAREAGPGAEGGAAGDRTAGPQEAPTGSQEPGADPASSAEQAERAKARAKIWVPPGA